MKRITNSELITMCNKFILSCSKNGLCNTEENRKECISYFQVMATSLGWINKVDIKV